MALVIIDPNLEGEAGHHLAYDMAIAREARARSEAVTIIANRRFAATSHEGVRILPHFTATTYAKLHEDPVTGAMDDWRHFNDLLQAELALLPRSEFGPGDAVLVPTTTEKHLAGYIGWMKAFDPIEAPLFLLHLMFPSGVAVDGAGGEVVEDPLRALFYRLAERAALEDGPPVHLFASGGQHAREFSALFGRTIPPHPVPICPAPDPARAEAPRRGLLFAGDARADKGVGLLPALVPMLAGAHPDWRWVAHVNDGAAWGPAKAAAEALAALAPGVPAFDLSGGRLAPAEYLDLSRSVDIALFPYDPVLYRRKSSGVLWEAISLGTPVVVPAGTWLENEARHWGAGHVAYAEHSAAAIAAGFAEALPQIDRLAAQSAEASIRYRAANGAAALLDQVAALWVRHKAAASLVARPRSLAVDLAKLDGGWHRTEVVEGRPMRWSALEPVIAFDWPFEEGWEIDITLGSFFGNEQLERTVAQADDTPVAVTWRKDGRGARLVLRGPGPGRARPRVDVRVQLPYTYRPQSDARDLGVLVAGMVVGPVTGSGGAARDPARLPAIAITTPREADASWDLAKVVTGELSTAPDRPVALAFRLSCAADAVPPPVTLHLGRASIPLHLSAGPDGDWMATTQLSRAALRAMGETAPFQILAEAGPRVRLIGAEIHALAGTTQPPLEEMAQPVAPKASAVMTAPDAAPPPSEPLLRWDLSEGIGPVEGPFPDIGVPAGVRWVVARKAMLVVEAPTQGPMELRLRYRCLLPRQIMRVTPEGGASAEVPIEGFGLKRAGEATVTIALQAGVNPVALHFAGGVKEPGTGRDLVLLIEEAQLG